MSNLVVGRERGPARSERAACRALASGAAVPRGGGLGMRARPLSRRGTSKLGDFEKAERVRWSGKPRGHFFQPIYFYQILWNNACVGPENACLFLQRFLFDEQPLDSCIAPGDDRLAAKLHAFFAF